MDYQEQPHSIILFDGVCNFCNASVNFIIKRDPESKFLFTQIQGDRGRALLANHGISNIGMSTFVLINQQGCHFKSDAALEIAKELSGVSRYLVMARYVPKFLRDKVYDFVAHNRYKIFGIRDECMIPSAEVRNRFL